MAHQADPGHIAKVKFVLLSSAGDEDLEVRLRIKENALVTVIHRIRKAISDGGVWSDDLRTFYPWHSINRVEWGRVEMNPEELDKEAAASDFRAAHPELLSQTDLN